jgi:hypothetical protein
MVLIKKVVYRAGRFDVTQTLLFVANSHGGGREVTKAQLGTSLQVRALATPSELALAQTHPPADTAVAVQIKLMLHIIRRQRKEDRDRGDRCACSLTGTTGRTGYF